MDSRKIYRDEMGREMGKGEGKGDGKGHGEKIWGGRREG